MTTTRMRGAVEQKSFEGKFSRDAELADLRKRVLEAAGFTVIAALDLLAI